MRSHRDESFHSARRERTQFLSLLRFGSALETLRRTFRLESLHSSVEDHSDIQYLSMSQYHFDTFLENESQSQTIRDDDTNNIETSKLNIDFENSNRKREESSNRTLSLHDMLSLSITKRKKKQRIKRMTADRRVIVNLTSEDAKAYRCTFKDNTRELIKKFSFIIEDDFVKLMKSDRDDVFETIKSLLDAYHAMNETSRNMQQKLTITLANNDQLKRRVETQKQKISDLFKEEREVAAQLAESNKLREVEKKKMTKLRRFKNAHRDNFEKVDVRARSLLIDKQTMQKTIEEFERRLRNTKMYDSSQNSDRENSDLRLSEFNRRSEDESRRRILRRDESLSNMTFESEARRELKRFVDGSSTLKHKYSELSLFYDDTAEWETWKTHLITKVQIDQYDFFTEWNKINYVRDKTRDNAQAIIWHKAKSNFSESYKKLKKLIEDLSNVFEKEEQNKHRTLLQQLFSSNFAMSAKNQNETFEKFLARFTSTMSSLRLSDDDKIMHLYRNLSNQLTERIYHLNDLTEYAKYLRDVRQIINQMKIRSDIKSSAPAFVTDKTREVRASKTSRKKTITKKSFEERLKIRAQFAVKVMLTRLSAHIRNRFKKEERCFKCESKKHMTFDLNAPCKNKEQITRESAEALLSKMSIEWTETDFAYWNDLEGSSKYMKVDDVQNDELTTSENWAFLSQIALRDFWRKCANESAN